VLAVPKNGQAKTGAEQQVLADSVDLDSVCLVVPGTWSVLAVDCDVEASALFSQKPILMVENINFYILNKCHADFA